MRKGIFAVGMALAVSAFAPSPARAADFTLPTFCTSTAFFVCLDVGLTDNGSGNWTITTMYASTNAPSGQEGVLTSFGIYDLLGGTNFTFSNVTALTSGWGAGSCNDLSGEGVGDVEACASANPPPTLNGIGVGESVAFSFDVTGGTFDANAFTAEGGLGVIGHVQAFGPNGCSLKPNSRTDDHVVDNVETVNARCGMPETTVPEPISMLLVGSGLFGVGAVRRRRKGLDVVNG